MGFLRYVPAVGVVLIGFGGAWFQWRAIDAVERDLERTRIEGQRASERPAATGEHAGASVDAKELERLRAARLELLRLRGEMSDLRRAAAEDKPELDRQVAELRRETAEAKAQADLVRARLEAEVRSGQVRDAMSAAVTLVKWAESRSDGRIPASWAEVQHALTRPGRTPEEEALQPVVDSMWTSASRREVPLEAFEFLPQPPPLAGRDSTAEAGVPVLRERDARPSPDGGWVRAYGYLGGIVMQAHSAAGDFSAWERESASGATPHTP